MKKLFLSVLMSSSSLAVWAQAVIPNLVDGKYGFKTETGSVVVNPKYDMALPFDKGAAYVGKKDAAGNVLQGAINKSGKEIVPLQFEYVTAEKDGYVIAGNFKDNKVVVYNLSGDMLFSASSDNIKYLGKGFFFVNDPDLKKGAVMNAQGEKVLPYDFFRVTLLGDYFDAEAYDASKNLLHGLYALDGKHITSANNYKYINQDPQLPHIYYLEMGNSYDKDYSIEVLNSKTNATNGDKYLGFEYASEGRILVRKKAEDGSPLYGFLNEEGKEVIPVKLIEAKAFAGGLSAVRTSDTDFNYSFINKDGKEAFATKATRCYGLGHGLAVVRANKEYAIWDAKGAVVAKIDVTGLGGSVSEAMIGSQSIVLMGGSKAGIVDHKGQWTCPPTYQKIEALSSNAFIAYDGKAHKVIDANGKQLLSETIERFNDLSKALHGAYWEVKVGDKLGIIDDKGALVVPAKYAQLNPYMVSADGWMTADIVAFGAAELVNHKTGKIYEIVGKKGFMAKMVDDNIFFLQLDGKNCYWKLDTNVRYCDK